jgi:DNA-binding HxlR family transcriptional regulator
LVLFNNWPYNRNREETAQEGTFVSPRHTHVTSHDPAACPAVREVLNRVGDKWSVQAIGLLSDGPKRFNELRRSIDGISQRMLTLTLRGLERDGLITRTLYPSVPPRVDYELTPLGRTLLEPVQALAAWAATHRFEIQDARERHDRSNAEPEPAKLERAR